MPLNRYINRLKRMEELIRKGSTGTPEEFASKMNLSRSAIMIYIKEMREMGASISYCSARQTYCFEKPVQFQFGFKPLTPEDMSKRNAGFMRVLF